MFRIIIPISSVAIFSCFPALAQMTRVSVGTGGVQANLHSNRAKLSADGRFVAFESSASNLVSGDTNGRDDVFVYDRQTGVTSRVSVSSTGLQGDEDSGAPAISTDGRFIAFQSIAETFESNDDSGWQDIFVRDRQTGITTRVSLDSSGVEGDFDSASPSISDDGRFVVFVSGATNLVAGDTNFVDDIFLRDRLLGTTTRTNLGPGGIEALGESRDPIMSADGRYVAFVSWAGNLVVGDTNGSDDIFVYERQTGNLTRVSVTSSGAQGTTDSGHPSLSADGRFVAFDTDSGLVAGDTNGLSDIFVHDRQYASTLRVSLTSAGLQGTLGGTGCIGASVSATGRFVTFGSGMSNLVAGDTNGRLDVFVHDRQSALTTRVSVDSTGTQGNNDSDWPSISSDGRYVALWSFSSNLVPGDTNASSDIFLRDRGVPLTVTPFCLGDGSGLACPCSNAGAAGHGCANSSFGVGALLGTSGVASVSGDTLVLTCSSLAGPGLFFQASGLTSPVTFGDGLLCAGLGIIRLGVVFPTAGTASYPGGLTPNPIHIAGAPIAATDVKHYQCWYRDAATFCTAATNNTSNGISLTWAP